MTPEERAKTILHGSLTAIVARDEEAEITLLAAEIRAAENDALERAAIVCDKYGGSDNSDFGKTIRALKHKEIT